MIDYLVVTDGGMFLVKAKDREHILSALADFLDIDQKAASGIYVNGLFDLSQYQMSTWKDGQVARLKS